MSSLLEQAIIDASALKEAAVKNAETAILNKYSHDIREAVENLLEQEDDLITTNDATDMETPDLPLAGAPAENGAEEIITLDFEELKEMAETLAEKDQELIGNEYVHAAASEESATIAAPDTDVEEVSVDVALEEDLELSVIEDILEELVVDVTPQKSGWAGTPESIMAHNEEMELARRSSTAAREKADALKDAVERLSEEKQILKNKNTKIIEALKALKENFDKVNLSNARLLYTNRILTKDSLNERQKHKIVESLSTAVSMD